MSSFILKSRQRSSAKSRPLSSSKILVVEDEKIARRELALFLEGKGYRVRRAQNGRKSVRAVETDSSIRVVVMDIAMPGELDGILAASEIRACRPDVSIIFITAFFKNPEYHRRVRDSDLRVAEWIQKPVNSEKKRHLLDTIQREIHKSKIRDAIEAGRINGTPPDVVINVLREYDQDIPQDVLLGIEEETVFRFDSEIDNLYHEISLLREEHLGSNLEELSDKIEKLRVLQRREAKTMRLHMENFLPIKLGEGIEVLERLKKELHDEDT